MQSMGGKKKKKNSMEKEERKKERAILYDVKTPQMRNDAGVKTAFVFHPYLYSTQTCGQPLLW